MLSDFALSTLDFYKSQQERFPLAFAQADFHQLQQISKLYKASIDRQEREPSKITMQGQDEGNSRST